jgi:L-iditol 2-dehydrogenase
MPFGHECAGIIAQVGDKVTGYKEGDRVVSAIAANCGECYWCVRNEPVFCINRTYQIPGGKMAGGAYAEYILIPSAIVKNNVHPIPDHVSYSEAALIEPLACALYGIEDLPEIRVGDTVVVNGNGPIGLFFVILAKQRGAHVISCGSGGLRKAKAEKFGADEVINYHEVDDQIKAVYELTGGPGPDVVIEATGIPEVWEMSVNMPRRGGTVMLFGGCKSGTTVTLDTQKIHYDCLTIKSPSVYYQDPDLLRRCMGLIADGVVPAQEFITGKFPLTDTENAVREYMKSTGLKYEVIPPDFWEN